MTILRKSRCPKCGHDLDPISNHFHHVEDGIGKRGSSFANIDAATHDRDGKGRFLFREFKAEGEALSDGQRSLMQSLGRLPGCMSALNVLLKNKSIAWEIFGSGEGYPVAVDQRTHCRLYGFWWANQPDQMNRLLHQHGHLERFVLPVAPAAPINLTAEDIRW